VEFGDYFEILLNNPVVWMGEIIGSVIILILIIRFRLYSKENLGRLFKKGKIVQ
jgi:hypothetical protein